MVIVTNKVIIIIVTSVFVFVIICTSVPFIVAALKTNKKEQVERPYVLLLTTPTPLQGEHAKELRYNYAELLNLTLLFFESQRSGKLPEDQKVRWRHDSCLRCFSPQGHDLTAGYYDNGHNATKSLHVNAHAVRNLAWALLRHRKVYEVTGLLERTQRAIMWGTDLLIQMMKNPKIHRVSPFNTSTWRRPEDVKDFKYDFLKHDSPVYGTAGSIAAASAVVRSLNATKANEYLAIAKKLFSFLNRGGRELGRMQQEVNKLQIQLHSISTAAWLSIADKENSEQYREMAIKVGAPFDASGNNFTFIDLYYQVLFFDLLGLTQPAYCHTLHNTPIYNVEAPRLEIIITCLHQGEALIRNNKYTQKKNPFTDIAVRETNNLLGDSYRSFVTGFGRNPPTRPYHVASSCHDNKACGEKDRLSPSANPNTLPGGLVNGYLNKQSYQDLRDPEFNSVTITSSTNLHVAAAILYDMHLEHRLDESAYHCRLRFHYTHNSSVSSFNV